MAKKISFISSLLNNIENEFMFTSNPRSSAVRSSDIAHNTFHRQSISAKYPRQIGDDALIANLN
jgi:hypothetical protein